jgi:L-fuconolactonase
MDGNGVDVVVVSPASVHPDNRYITDLAAGSAGRLRAVVKIDPQDPQALATVAGHAAAGAVGLRANLIGGGSKGPGQDDWLDPLIDAAAVSDLVIQWTFRVPDPSMAMIARAANRAPGIRQVLDHLGLPVDPRDLGSLDRMRDLAAVPGLSVKLSGLYALTREGYPYRDLWPWIEGVLAVFGAARTMWASDWPLSGESDSYLRQLALIDRLPFLDAAARRDVLGASADRFWRLAATGPGTD